jgi:hypothetical protein
MHQSTRKEGIPVPTRERVLTRAAAYERRNRFWLSLWLNVQLAWLVGDYPWTRYIWRLHSTGQGLPCTPTWYRMRRRDYGGSIIALTEVEIDDTVYTLGARPNPYSLLLPTFNWVLCGGEFIPQPGEAVLLTDGPHKYISDRQEFAEQVLQRTLRSQAAALSASPQPNKLPIEGTRLLPRPAKPTDES